MTAETAETAETVVNLDAIRVVLVEPQHPGNIGAVARAMKTMGLKKLYVVRPKAQLPSYEAERRAAGSLDVLEGAVVTEDLDEVTGDCRLVVGATARSRSQPHPVIDARVCGKKLVAESAVGEPVAVLFGPERTGLSNEDLNRCSLEVRIPTSVEFSSLNLAAAVQLLCYEVQMAARAASAPEGGGSSAATIGEYPSQREMEFFFRHLEQTLDERGFTADARREVTFSKLRRLFGRARPHTGELKLLHSLVKLMGR